MRFTFCRFFGFLNQLATAMPMTRFIVPPYRLVRLRVYMEASSGRVNGNYANGFIIVSDKRESFLVLSSLALKKRLRY